MPRAAAIYCRISDDREGRQLGVARQRGDCLELAERKGWPVAQVYVDNDVSAYSGKRRPAYRQMLKDLKEGIRDAVVVYHQDRLVRLSRELEEFFDCCDAAGVTDLASVTGNFDLADDSHRTIVRILGAVAQQESNDKRRRIRRKHLELAEGGQVSGGGTRPYGYADDKRTVRAAEARVIQDAAKRILAGDSLRSVCAHLNENGITTVTGRQWVPSGLSRMLTSARISGQREHHGEIIGPAVWPGIITPAQTARLRTLLRDPSRRRTRPARRYLLAGMLRCRLCGAVLISRPRSDGERRYICATGPGMAGCGKIAIMAAPVEAFVVEAVLLRLDTPELETALRGEIAADDAASAIQADLDEALAHADELARTYAQKAISMREWLAARGPIEARVEASRRDLSRVSRTPVVSDYLGRAGVLRTQWADLDLSRQQAIVAAILDHVTIGPGVRGLNRFDASRLDPIWRP